MKADTRSTNDDEGPHRTRLTFPKSERLCQRRAFDHLFEHRNSFRMGVLTFFYAKHCPAEWIKAPLSVAFSAPKRGFKRAVDRNLLKRRMKEAYRLHKAPLYHLVQQEELSLVLLVKFHGRRIGSYHRIERDLRRGLDKLARNLAPDSET
ncbi:MAG: ribonuclease P protein component [Bacteroidota bacterium]